MITQTPLIPPSTTGATAGAKVPATAQPQAGGMMGFLTALLAHLKVGQDGAEVGQNAVAGQQGTGEPVNDLAAKISALLEKTGGTLDAATLEQVLPPGLAKTVADRIASLQSLLDGTQTTPPVIASPFQPTLLDKAPTPAPALTSDLTSTHATTAQDQTALEALAAQLNDLTPGAAPAASAASNAFGTTDGPTAPDAGKISTPEVQIPAATSLETTEQTAALIVQSLSATAPEMAETVSSEARPVSALAQLGQKGAEKGPGVQTGNTEAVSKTTASHVENSAEAVKSASSPQTSAQTQGQVLPQTTAAATTAALQQSVAQQPAAQQQPAHPAGLLGSSLGTLNNMLSAQLGNNSFGQGFGERTGADAGTGFTTDAAASEAARISAGSGSFTTYLQAAAKGGTSAATTQMIGLQISRNAQAKVDTFTMQLDPADLGALEVRMSFGKDGKMSAKLIAEKPETLSMLQRDSMHLERVLQQSGIEVADNALSFDLREGNQQSLYNRDGANDESAYAGRGDRAQTQATDTLTAQLAVQATGYISRTGVNIMV